MRELTDLDCVSVSGGSDLWRGTRFGEPDPPAVNVPRDSPFGTGTYEPPPTFGECFADNIGENILTGMAVGAGSGAILGAAAGAPAAGVGAVPGAAGGATTGAIVGVFEGIAETGLGCWWFGP